MIAAKWNQERESLKLLIDLESSQPILSSVMNPKKISKNHLLACSMKLYSDSEILRCLFYL